MDFRALILNYVLRKVKDFLYWTVWYTFFIKNKPSPKPRIKNYSLAPDGTLHVPIGVLPESIWITEIAPSRSMSPWLDSTDKIILIKAVDTDIVVGDVIVYAKNGNNSDLIIHQIVSAREDGDGKYYICRGINNYVPDPFRVRPSWVRWVMIGVLY